MRLLIMLKVLFPHAGLRPGNAVLLAINNYKLLPFGTILITVYYWKKILLSRMTHRCIITL